MNYDLSCRCGHRLTGRRTVKFQDVKCPQCGRVSLVFPISPLALAFGTVSAPQPVSAGRRRWPLFVVGVSIVAVAGALLLSLVNFSSDPKPIEPTVGDLRAAATLALRRGDHRAAAELFSEAERVAGGAERAEFRQFRVQAGLIADLPSESVSEMLRRVPGTTDKVWEAQFRQRYRGKSVLFDAPMYRDAAGRFQLDFLLWARGGDARIAWDDLKMLGDLPLDEPTRLIFGARLESASLTEAGWLIRLQPDSGVLFTDAEVFTGTPLPPADQETREVLARQAQWLRLRDFPRIDD